MSETTTWIGISPLAFAFHRFFSDAYGEAGAPIRPEQKVGNGCQQHYVSVELPEDILSFDEMEHRIIEQAAYNLASHLQKGCAFGVLPIASTPDLSCTWTSGDISVRATYAVLVERILDEDGKVIGHDDPVSLLRFDVLTVQP